MHHIPFHNRKSICGVAFIFVLHHGYQKITLQHTEHMVWMSCICLLWKLSVRLVQSYTLYISFPYPKIESYWWTYLICLSCRVDENSIIKSILYLSTFCFIVSSHCVWSFTDPSLLVRSLILFRLQHDFTTSSQNLRKFWHWNYKKCKMQKCLKHFQLLY